MNPLCQRYKITLRHGIYSGLMHYSTDILLTTLDDNPERCGFSLAT
ncbi:hypothetical protein HMPREF1869_00160 [Bacteroidales bacterium KA00251]|nr:hypothetical protein HMPREF1869_00160 [Bacteroidales bacterium KA00251]